MLIELMCSLRVCVCVCVCVRTRSPVHLHLTSPVHLRIRLMHACRHTGMEHTTYTPHTYIQTRKMQATHHEACGHARNQMFASACTCAFTIKCVRAFMFQCRSVCNCIRTRMLTFKDACHTTLQTHGRNALGLWL